VTSGGNKFYDFLQTQLIKYGATAPRAPWSRRNCCSGNYKLWHHSELQSRG